MTTDFLKNLGIESEDTIREILKQNGLDIENVKTETAEFKKQIKELTDQKQALDIQVTELKQDEETFNALKQDKENLEKENQGYKRTELQRTIAQEEGIPATMANRINGVTEEELRADALALKEIINANKPDLPGRSTEPADLAEKDKNAKYLNLYKSITD